VSQRLVRKLCECARPTNDPQARLGLAVTRSWLPAGCERCNRSGYHGRLLLAEMLTAQPSEIGRAVLSRDDSARIEQLAVSLGMVTRWQRAFAAVESGATSPAEVRRVLGFSDPPPSSSV
jgi:general secretion pathway protein E